MSGDPTVLGMINKNLTEINVDIKEIKEDLKSGAVKMENHEQRIRQNSKKAKAAIQKIEKHEDKKEVHWNEAIANETLPQRLRRKLPTYTIVGGGSAGGLYLIIEIIKWAIENLS